MANRKPQIGKHSILSDFLEYCRVCMTKRRAMKALFDPGSKIVDEIHYCTGILITEDKNLPSFVCLNCLSKLATAHKFKSTCINTNITFTSLLEDIKLEVTGDDAQSEDAVVKLEIGDENISDNVVLDNFVPDDDITDVDDDMNLEKVTKLVSKKSVKKKKKSKPKNYCTKCDIHFKNAEEMMSHQRRHQKDALNCHWICEVCGKEYWKYAAKYSHIRTHQPPKHACSYCDYKTTYKSDLVKHIHTHTGEKKYHCHLCTGSFRTSSCLHGHILWNHTQDKRHTCEKCDKSFYTKCKLKRHMDSHNNIKRFECDVCRSCFTRRCQWRRHMMKQHNQPTPLLRPGRQKTDAIMNPPPSIFN